jgi:hypothetical protein
MRKLWFGTFYAYFKKEILETVTTMRVILLLSIFSSCVMQHVIVQAVEQVWVDNNTFSSQLGYLLIYLDLMLLLFFGHTLINRFVYEEKTQKTICIMLGSGMSKTAMWAAKLLATFLMSYAILLVSIASHMIVTKVIYGIWIQFTLISGLLVFFSIPMLCFGFLSLVSVAYWFFSNMQVFSFVFPLVTYLGIWNIAVKLVTLTYPVPLVFVTVLIGIICFLIAFVLVKHIPKERIIAYRT